MREKAMEGMGNGISSLLPTPHLAIPILLYYILTMDDILPYQRLDFSSC